MPSGNREAHAASPAEEGQEYPFRGVLSESFADCRPAEKPARGARGRGEARPALPAEGGREGPPLNGQGQECPTLNVHPRGTHRRQFLAASAALAAGGLLTRCDPKWRESFFRKRFTEMTKEDRERVLDGLTLRNQRTFGKPFKVTAEEPEAGASLAYGLDLSRCIGCRRCVYACVVENNQSRDPQIHWIKVLEMEKETGVDLFESTAYYDPDKVPREDHFYVPVACQQCRRPQCTTVCPVGATWKEPDGIVVIDYDWCIGCRYCMVACPYGARHFNWARPKIPKSEVNRDTHYLGNRPRYRGVVEKCTFCIQRVRKPNGRYPACVEVCPAGARKFGDLNDPKSEMRQLIANKRVFILKEDLNMKPRFYYFYGV